jgi:hypothetical protein
MAVVGGEITTMSIGERYKLNRHPGERRDPTSTEVMLTQIAAENRSLATLGMTT